MTLSRIADLSGFGKSLRKHFRCYVFSPIAYRQQFKTETKLGYKNV